jgi:imidazole glycerol-phosphate synthase subunit HisH
MKVGIIDIGIGNLASVSNALIELEMETSLCRTPEQLNGVDALILPGVGAFPTAMDLLRSRGFDEAIKDYTTSGRVLVGICLGMQLLFTESEEISPTFGLNLIPGTVNSLTDLIQLPVPHMGWNNITTDNSQFKIFEGDYYFVHSFACYPFSRDSILFEVSYGDNLTAAVTSGDGIFGLQFHPEKSQRLGLELLRECLVSC